MSKKLRRDWGFFNNIHHNRTCDLKRMLFCLLGFLSIFTSSSCQNQAFVIRKHPSDQFHILGSCAEDACIGESSGTAELAESCTCRCLSYLPIFREDLNICVDDIHECSVAPFVTGSTYQKVPYVFLPHKGQIVHPSSEIRFNDVKSPICVVSSAKFLTKSGWVELRNKSEAEPPFRLFKDEGKIYLQWLGESELRLYMEGRLILVHLLCKDTNDGENKENSIFTPCISFRVSGAQSEASLWGSSGVREVTFSVDNQASGTSSSGGSYMPVVICSVVIGFVYVASVVLYIQLRKKNSNEKNSSSPHIGVAEEGIVKNNPLLRHCRENALYLPESGTSCTDSDGSSERNIEETANETSNNVQVTSAVVHPCSYSCDREKSFISHMQDPTIEKHPEGNVAIIETLESRDEKSDKVCAVACSNVRRKLYFNPAFFQHELLLAPPPAAIEFLTKIREVIAIAKSKMQAKRFSPTLIRIPEENENRSSDNETCNGSNTNQYAPSVMSNRMFSSDGINGCRSCCKTPENKQRSVEKWLANVPIVNGDNMDDKGSSVWAAENDSSFKLGQLRKEFFPSGEDVADKESVSELTTNYCNKNLLLLDNTRKKKKDNFLKGDKTPDILYSIPIVSSLTVPNNEPERRMSSTSSFKPHIEGQKECKENYVQVFSDKGSVKSEEPTFQYEPVDKRSFDDSLSGTELETMEFKGGFAVPCDYVDVHQSDIVVSPSNLRYYGSENIYSTRAISEINLNDKKDDHDYEMIMLNNMEETKSLPDFCSRTDGYSLISEVYVNSGYGFSSSQSSLNSDSDYSAVSEKQVKVIKNGLEHLTINIKEVPTHHKNEDSEFEPDTLDRKPNNLVIPGDTTSKLQITSDFFTDSLERQAQISLKTTGSFRNDSGSINPTSNRNRGVVHNKAFGSLREIFMAKNRYNHCTHRSGRPYPFSNVLNSRSLSQISSNYWSIEEPTLKPESKQARRQRQPDPPNQSLIGPPQPDFVFDLPDVTAFPSKQFKLDSSTKENLFPNQIHDCDQVSSMSCPLDHMCISHYPSETNNDRINPRLNQRNLERFGNQQCPMGNVKSKILDYEPITTPLHLDNLKVNSSKNKTNKLMLHMNRTEDSGYLSTDSNTSDKPLRREGSLSETDDSFFDGASESGAESIATDSFFFGKIRRSSIVKSLESQS